MVVVDSRAAAKLAWDCTAHVARAMPGLNNYQVENQRNFPNEVSFGG